MEAPWSTSRDGALWPVDYRTSSLQSQTGAERFLSEGLGPGLPRQEGKHRGSAPRWVAPKDDLTAFRVNRGFQAAQDDEDRQAEAREAVDYFPLHIQALHHNCARRLAAGKHALAPDSKPLERFPAGRTQSRQRARLGSAG
jgi:hypothetical protein